MGAYHSTKETIKPRKKPSRKKSSLLSLGKHTAVSSDTEFDTVEIIDLLRKYEVDLNPHLNSSYNLKLDCETNPDGIESFLIRASDYRLDNIRKIWISPVSFLSEEGLNGLNQFFTNSIPPTLEILHLKSVFSNLGEITSGLSHALQSVRRQVAFDHFNISQKNLECVINNTIQAKQLVFFNCKFMDFERDLKFDTKVHYQLRSISLWMSCGEDNPDKFDESKLEKFAKALAKTNILDTLTDIRVDEGSFPPKKVKQIFKKHGFHLKVRDDPLVLD